MMIYRGEIRIGGLSTLRAWRAGVIGVLLERGYTLDEAQAIARTMGALAHEDTKHNLIVTDGLGLIVNCLIDAEAGITYHAIGTGTTAPSVSDTLMTTESKRKAITTRTVSAAVATFSTFYTSAECTYNIKECGLFGGDAVTATENTGTLFSHYLQSYDNSGGTYDLTFNYELTAARA